MDSVYDVWTGESCCGVAHAHELVHTFGFLDPSSSDTLAWEVDVTEYISDQISSIVQTGKANIPTKSTFNMV